MGNKKTTKNLLYLLGIVLIIAAALLLYASYANKAQAPSNATEIIPLEENISVESTEVKSIESQLNSVDDLSTEELDSAKEDIDSINLSEV